MNVKKNLKELWQKHRMLLILTSGVILLQTLVGAALWDQLPEQIATHFDFNNQPDGYSSRAFTVFGMPLVLLALHWLCLLISCSPKYQMRNYSGKIKYLMLLIVPAISLMMTVIVYGYALGAPFNVGRVVLYAGVIFYRYVYPYKDSGAVGGN